MVFPHNPDSIRIEAVQEDAGLRFYLDFIEDDNRDEIGATLRVVLTVEQLASLHLMLAAGIGDAYRELAEFVHPPNRAQEGS